MRNDNYEEELRERQRELEEEAEERLRERERELEEEYERHKTRVDEITGTNSGGCFIATAAYGTPFANEIDVLREWRDKTLQTTIPGKSFVKTYYKYAPRVAKYIENREFLKGLTRLILYPLVRALKVVGYRRK